MRTNEETKAIRFHGCLERGGAEQFVAHIEFNRWDATSLAVSLFLTGEQSATKRAEAAFHEMPHRVKLNGVDPRDRSVELKGISSFSRTSKHIELMVAEVAVGIDDLKLSHQRGLSVIVRMRPSGILIRPASRTLSYTGEIENELLSEDEVTISTPFGKLVASDTYEYQTVVEHGNKVTKQVQRMSLMGELSLAAGMSLEQMHEQLLKHVEEACVALSLCYRQRVNFYEIEYVEHTEGRHLKEAFFRRRLADSQAKSEREQLVDIGALVGGGLESLIQGIRSAKDAVTVRRAIRFLAASSDAALETAYFMSFSAMEAIVNSCLEDDGMVVMPSRTWKKVEPRLRTAIDEIEQSLQVSLGGLKEKLPELRRKSLRARVLAVCDQLKPEVNDLWSDLSFVDGLRRATDVRNGLFHTADATELDSMYGDLIRVRVLAERIILKQLGWPDERIWRWCDQELRSVN